MNDPVIDPRLATIIDPVKLREAKDASEKARKEAEARDFFERWDRAGRRAFKGIMPRPIRMQMLKSALRRLEQNES